MFFSFFVSKSRKIADVFEVTLDYLVDESAIAAFDKEIIKRLNDIQGLNNEDKKLIFGMMDAFLRDAKARKAYS